jgi:hypothetical protein
MIVSDFVRQCATNASTVPGAVLDGGGAQEFLNLLHLFLRIALASTSLPKNKSESRVLPRTSYANPAIVGTMF